MNNTTKRMIKLVSFVIALLFLFIILLVVINKKENFGNYTAIDKNNNEIHVNDNLKNNVNTQDFIVNNLKLKILDSKTEVYLDIANKSEQRQMPKTIQVIFYDKDNQVLDSFQAYVIALESGEKTSVKETIYKNVSNAYSYSVFEK